MSFKRNMIRVFSSNFILMLSAITVGFLVPNILSIEGYANLKTYTLYMAYVTLLQFGFKEGIYIKYGGMEEDEIDKGILKGEHLVFTIFQLLITALFVFMAIKVNDPILLLMAISILPINLKTFHYMYYQATGQFKKYTRINNMYTLMYFLGNISLVLLFKSRNYIFYCALIIVIDIIIVCYLEYSFLKRFGGIKPKLSKEVFNNIKVGFFILLGNLSVTIFYSLDKWFVKLGFSTEDFVYYSFAISMLTLINVLINSIGIIFYNYLAKSNDEKRIKRAKNYLLIIGVFSSSAYFAFSFIINLIMDKYTPSLNILAILFLGYPYLVVIKTLYINMYKVNKKEKKYLKVIVGMTVVGIVLNFLAMNILRSYEGIAIGTIVGFIIWYIYSSFDFKYLKPNLKEASFLFINGISFLLSIKLFNIYLGFLVYVFIVLLSTIFIYKEEVKETFSGVSSLIKKKNLIKKINV